MSGEQDSLRRLQDLLTRAHEELETELKGALKIVFWAALLAPVIIVPVYYLLVAFGLLPGLHLPG